MSIEIQNAVEDAILDLRPFNAWADGVTSRYAQPLSAHTPFGTVTVDKDGSKLNRSDATYYSGEWEQDSTEEVYILFRVKSEGFSESDLFFKKFGLADSYGQASFDGKFRQVFPKVKQVTVYDYE